MAQVTLRTLKIRNNKLTGLESPIKMKVTPKFEAIFDVDGTTEVPEAIAKRLLGPGYPGAYSLVTETTPTVTESKKEEVKVVEVVAEKKGVVGRPKKEVQMEAPKPGLNNEQKEFVKQII